MSPRLGERTVPGTPAVRSRVDAFIVGIARRPVTSPIHENSRNYSTNWASLKTASQRSATVGRLSRGFTSTAVGFILSGAWSTVLNATQGGPKGGPIELLDLSERFSVGFTRKSALVPPSFSAGQVGQIEFSAEVPWVLSEPCTR